MLDRDSLCLQLGETYKRLTRQVDSALARGDRYRFVQTASYRNNIVRRYAGLIADTGIDICIAYSPASEAEDEYVESV